jgi:hypothetical protein
MMKKTVLFLFMVLTFMTGLNVFPRPVQATVEWDTLKEIDLQTETLDVAASPDEQLLFLLTRGEVLVYSLRENRITERIPLDKDFDRLTYLPRTNALLLTGSSKKNLRIVRMEFIQNFDLSELPYQGPEDAPVTVVVFNDYQ